MNKLTSGLVGSATPIFGAVCSETQHALSSDSDGEEEDDERSTRQIAIGVESASLLNEATLTYGDTGSIAPFVDSLPSRCYVFC